MRACSRRGTSCGLQAMTAATNARASSSPAAAAHSASTTLSVSSWRTMRPRPAPSAVRTAISRARAAPRASSRLATLPQAISSTSADRREQRQQPLPDVADELLDERHRPEADGLVVFRKIVAEAQRRRRRACACTCWRRDAGLQPAVHREVVLVVHRPLRGRERNRRPQLLAVGGEVERLRHHAGDLVGRRRSSAARGRPTASLAPKRRVHRRWLSTTTRSLPGRSSSAVNVRPRIGRTPMTSK